MTVFTSEYVAAATRRWSATPESGQPLVARIAMDPDRQDDRDRIEAWVARVHSDDQSAIAARLQSKDHFLTAYGELMTAQVLMNAGFAPRYEPRLSANGRLLTPDWVMDGEPKVICDAFTAGCTEDRDGHETSLREIEDRLKKLPQKGMIRVEIADAAVFDAGERKRLVGEISAWLATCPGTGEYWNGDEMLVEMMVVGGNRLDIIVSDPIHQIVTPASVASNFDAKAKRYGCLELPLIVVAVKHPSAEIADDDVEDVVLGELAYVSRETIDGRIVGRTERLPGGVLELRPEISAAMWIYPYSLPPRVQTWANSAARHPLAPGLIEALATAAL